MRKFLERHKANLVLILSGLLSYLLLSQLLDVEVSGDYMFDRFWKNADSVSYLEVANWIFKGVPTEHLAYRPVMFPIIVGITIKLGGTWLLWAFQVACYTGGYFFVHKSVFNATSKRSLAVLASLFYLSNFSLIGISYHALTECLVVLLLAVLVFRYSKTDHQYRSLASAFYWTWGILGILSVVKPVFVLPFWVIGAGILYMIVRKKWKLKRHQVLRGTLIVLIFLTQCFIIYQSTGKFKVSTIGEKTLRDYLCVQVLQETEGIDRKEALLIVNAWSFGEVTQLFQDEPAVFLKYYFRNIDANIRADSFVERYDDPSINKVPAIYMRTYNDVLMLIFGAICIWIVLVWLRFVPSSLEFVLNLVLFLLMLYVILTSGIAHSQRDRIILILLPIWIFLLSNLINSIRVRQETKISGPT